ncbi:hypothetical protein [Pinibacter aurantiacus]|uniref:Lipocalin-like domain-containing protein n=1 Tax=Pinibacter aurantiacus TaxID=2851599 RepID=A0A9E2SA76_9BACT|nr:hypothetical protein [Pinibacter aurantiacus]MBV4356720.1 hypothetical protein [Pinibacter aurantiacus]
MKKNQIGLIKIVFSILLITVFQISCTKSSEPTQSNSELPIDQALVQKTWMVDQLHHVIAGKYSAYQRNGANTTGTSYDNLRFTFKSDGTGVHIDENNKSVNFTWKFTSEDMHSLAFTEYTRTNNWLMFEIKGNYLYASTNLILSGDPNNIETFRLVKVP